MTHITINTVSQF